MLGYSPSEVPVPAEFGESANSYSSSKECAEARLRGLRRLGLRDPEP